jgi:hypothetical protein
MSRPVRDRWCDADGAHSASFCRVGRAVGRSLDCTDTVGSAPSGITYQQWGWPVTLHRDQVRLQLDGTVSAWMVPARRCAGVIPVLIQRRCAPPVLAHPYAPEHCIVLTGEKYEPRLPWPEQVKRGHRSAVTAPHLHLPRADHLDHDPAAGVLATVPGNRPVRRAAQHQRRGGSTAERSAVGASARPYPLGVLDPSAQTRARPGRCIFSTKPNSCFRDFERL